MHKKILKRFFNEIRTEEQDISAAMMANFQIKMVLYPETENIFKTLIEEVVNIEDSERRDKISSEQAEIASAETYAQIIKMMRRAIDVTNRHILAKRAAEFGGELVSEVIRMLKTSLNTDFIESAAFVLSICNEDIAEELIECFDDVRCPYAQCMILVALGFKANDSIVPWLIEKHRELKRKYPDKDYHDGAYYALCEIERRFYL